MKHIVAPPIGMAPGKAEQVEAMFDQIAPRYDLLNRLLSFGTDVRWRRAAVNYLASELPADPGALRLLDVATGTADLALALARRLNPAEVVGIDLSAQMLARGRDKVAAAGLSGVIPLVQGDAADLPFEAETFDGATVAFGVRNFENLRAGLEGIRRVLRTGAPLVVLEFSHPRAFPIKQGYEFYSRHVMPRVGRAVSNSRTAYDYLPESVAAFPDDMEFLSELQSAGFGDVAQRRLTFGVASLYRGRALAGV
jgi:demethylmenaquinone methyltransferase/2-methoxy-6-polyprenyl-1,4-benzoquinol methylase